MIFQNFMELIGANFLKLCMYDAAKAELVKSKRMNVTILIIAIVAMLGAIASPLITWLVTL